jgi:hypothetical protein
MLELEGRLERNVNIADCLSVVLVFESKDSTRASAMNSYQYGSTQHRVPTRHYDYSMIRVLASSSPPFDRLHYLSKRVLGRGEDNERGLPELCVRTRRPPHATVRVDDHMLRLRKGQQSTDSITTVEEDLSWLSYRCCFYYFIRLLPDFASTFTTTINKLTRLC